MARVRAGPRPEPGE